MNQPPISLVAALGHERAIGRNGQVPWHLPADQKHWRGLVRGHAVIMGSATYSGLGVLDNSTNIVVSSQNINVPGGLVAHSLEKAFDLARQHDNQEIFVIGGAGIFAETIGLADKLHLTYVDIDVPDADRFFPDYENDFRELSSTEPADENGLTYRFVELERK